MDVLTAIGDLLLTLLLAACGVFVGWWIRGGKPARASDTSEAASAEVQRAREALARLREVALRVAADVGEHNQRVEAINDELSAVDASDPEVVVGTVAKLLQANQQMQEQLESAEGKLREQARQIESHAAEARTDPLTGLANRRALDAEMARRLAEFRAQGKRFSLLMIDVDHFKKFNDTHGHQAGDEVLRGVAAVLRRNARDSDLVARYGGEEFAMVFPGLPASEAFGAVERVRQAIEQARFHFQGTELRVTASLGLAEILAAEENARLIERADEALYASKKAGRNCAHWHDGRAIHAIGAPAGGQAPPSPPPETPGQAASGAGVAPAKRPPPPPAPQPPPPVRPTGAPESAPGEAGVVWQTSLPNRTAFCMVLSGRLAEWRRDGKAPAVLLMRIDRYDETAASRGAHACAQIVRAVVRFLLSTIREMDLVAHYDADCFAVLLPGASLAVATAVAERLRTALVQLPVTVAEDTVPFTVSVGGAETRDGDTAAMLLSRAEEALAAAVKSGGNCCYFHNGQWCETLATARERALALPRV